MYIFWCLIQASSQTEVAPYTPALYWQDDTACKVVTIASCTYSGRHVTLCIRGPRTRAESTQRPVMTTSAPWSRARAIGKALHRRHKGWNWIQGTQSFMWWYTLHTLLLPLLMHWIPNTSYWPLGHLAHLLPPGVTVLVLQMSQCPWDPVNTVTHTLHYIITMNTDLKLLNWD